jgi:branched-chain amino acid transport system ATP-binding protein
METLFGSDITTFIGVTVVLFGGASFIMGQALAQVWRPAWQNVVYGLLLGLANRFIVFALFDGPLLSLLAYVSNTAVLIALALIAYRMTKVRKMVSQYPWLYEQAGLFTWRQRSPS